MGRNILLVFYSSGARCRLETTLLAWQLEVYAIDGWASSAVAELKEHPAEMVILDHGHQDVSLTQAVRRVGQVLPGTLVVLTSPDSTSVKLFRGGHPVGSAMSLETALGMYAGSLEP